MSLKYEPASGSVPGGFANSAAVCHTADFEGFLKTVHLNDNIGPTVGNRVGT